MRPCQTTGCRVTVSLHHGLALDIPKRKRNNAIRAIDGHRPLTDATAMAVAKPRPLTKFDYWQFPETGPRYQLINRDLYMAPAQNRFHQDSSRTIQFEIRKYLERQPRGIIYNAPCD